MRWRMAFCRLVFSAPCRNLFWRIPDQIPDLGITAVTAQRVNISFELVLEAGFNAASWSRAILIYGEETLNTLVA